MSLTTLFSQSEVRHMLGKCIKRPDITLEHREAIVSRSGANPATVAST